MRESMQRITDSYIAQARALLKEYMTTGLIVIPAHIKAKGSENKYKHDGDPEAGRNFKRKGWRAPLPETEARKACQGAHSRRHPLGLKSTSKAVSNAKKMAAIEAYAKEHGCSITQATVALM